MSLWKGLAVVIIILLLIAGGIVVYYFEFHSGKNPIKNLVPTTTTSSSTTSSTTTSSYSTTLYFTSSTSKINGNYDATIISVQVSQIGYDLSNHTTVYRSTILLQFPLQNGTLARYSFSIVPWNASIINGTTSVATFSNGMLTELQPDSAGVIFSHTHIFLNMIVNGIHLLVPSGLGISNGTMNQYKQIYNGIQLTIHTHDLSDVVHFESSVPNANFTLGEMFSEWGYAFNSTCLWGSFGGHVTVYLNSSSKPYPTPYPQDIQVPHNIPANTPYNVTLVWT